MLTYLVSVTLVAMGYLCLFAAGGFALRALAVAIWGQGDHPDDCATICSLMLAGCALCFLGAGVVL